MKDLEEIDPLALAAGRSGARLTRQRRVNFIDVRSTHLRRSREFVLA